MTYGPLWGERSFNFGAMGTVAQSLAEPALFQRSDPLGEKVVSGLTTFLEVGNFFPSSVLLRRMRTVE